MAADMNTGPAPVLTKASPMGPANWTGCYIGGEGGYAYGPSKHTAESGIDAGLDITPSFNLNGEIAGGTFGCNYQTSNFVLGLEDDLSWTNKKGNASDQLPFNPFAISETNEKLIDTLRGPASPGSAFFCSRPVAAPSPISGSMFCNTIRVICVSDSSNVWGWTFGVGIEWTAWDNWPFKAEYLRVDFGTPHTVSGSEWLGDPPEPWRSLSAGDRPDSSCSGSGISSSTRPLATPPRAMSRSSVAASRNRRPQVPATVIFGRGW
jgi:outer membrane immunogenic protein